MRVTMLVLRGARGSVSTPTSVIVVEVCELRDLAALLMTCILIGADRTAFDLLVIFDNLLIVSRYLIGEI